MPWDSEKQRKWMYANKPELAKKMEKHSKQNYKDGGVAEDKDSEPSVWERFKEGFKPKVDRIKDEETRKARKRGDYHKDNWKYKKYGGKYEHGGVVDKPRRKALAKIMKKYK